MSFFYTSKNEIVMDDGSSLDDNASSSSSSSSSLHSRGTTTTNPSPSSSIPAHCVTLVSGFLRVCMVILRMILSLLNLGETNSSISLSKEEFKFYMEQIVRICTQNPDEQEAPQPPASITSSTTSTTNMSSPSHNNTSGRRQPETPTVTPLRSNTKSRRTTSTPPSSRSSRSLANRSVTPPPPPLTTTTTSKVGDKKNNNNNKIATHGITTPPPSKSKLQMTIRVESTTKTVEVLVGVTVVIGSNPTASFAPDPVQFLTIPGTVGEHCRLLIRENTVYVKNNFDANVFTRVAARNKKQHHVTKKQLILLPCTIRVADVTIELKF